MTDQMPPLAPEAAKITAPTTRSRIIRGVQILSAVVILIVWAISFMSRNDLPTCDSSDTKTSLSDIFKSKNINAKSYKAINTVSESKTEVLCTASVVLDDDSILEFDYRLFYGDKGDKQLVITAAREAPKP